MSIYTASIVGGKGQTKHRIDTLLKATLACLILGGLAIANDTANQYTGDAASIDPAEPSYFGNFAPELPITVARKPMLDPTTGLAVQEVKPGLFYVTDGIYQSAFLVTGSGIVVFYTPKTFAERLPAVIAQSVPGNDFCAVVKKLMNEPSNNVEGTTNVFNFGIDALVAKS